MKQIFNGLARLALISSAGFALATLSNWGQHKGYWNGTINRVQTVDLNILAHTLPTKLSAVLLAEDKEELERTINSNYGLFGIVVTDCKAEAKDCPDQQILYSTESNLAWKQQLKVLDLPNHPYDLLRNPPPLLSEGKYHDTRSLEREVTGRTNPGEIIGRVYYVRGIPPSFIDDYTNWLLKPLSTSGAHKYYLLTTGLYLVGGVAVWLVIQELLYRKRLQQQHAQEELKRLQGELQKKNQHIPKLIAQNEQTLAEVGRRQTQQEELIHELKQDIAEYENELVEKERQQKERAETLVQLQKELTEIQLFHTEAQEEIQKRSQAIAQLQQQIGAWEVEKQTRVEILKELRQELQDTQQQKSEFQRQVEEQRKLIQSLTQKLEEAEQESRLLEKRLAGTLKVSQLEAALETARVESERISKHYRDAEEYFLQEHQNLQIDYRNLETKHEQLKLQLEEAQSSICKLAEELNKYKVQSSLPAKAIDLSRLRLALVGGHQNTRSGVLSELKQNYGLQVFTEIEPSKRKCIDQTRLKAKLSNCDLIVVITGYMGHTLSDSVMSLKNSCALRGDVLKLEPRYHATTSIVREIIAYFASKN